MQTISSGFIQFHKTFVLVAEHIDITVVDIEPHGENINSLAQQKLIQEREVLERFQLN